MPTLPVSRSACRRTPYAFAPPFSGVTQTPDDYVVGIGETRSVRELCEVAFRAAGLDYRDHVLQDERFMRPAEVDLLVGDASKARTQLGWAPEVSFRELVEMMVDADLARHRAVLAAAAR